LSIVSAVAHNILSSLHHVVSKLDKKKCATICVSHHPVVFTNIIGNSRLLGKLAVVQMFEQPFSGVAFHPAKSCEALNCFMSHCTVQATESVSSNPDESSGLIVVQIE